MHLIKRLEEHGDAGAADLLRQIGHLGDAARDLAYRLHSICERRKWTKEALAFNSLVTSWPDVSRLAANRIPAPPSSQLPLDV